MSAEPSPEEAQRKAGRRLVTLLNEGIPLVGRHDQNREELDDRVDRLDQTRGD